MIKTCLNCGHTVNENFCPNCGQPAKLKRIDRHYITHEIQHLLHFEKGFLYTIKELLTRPGLAIKTYIRENRNRLIKPIPFLIFTSLIYTLVNSYFHIEDSMVSFGGPETVHSGEKTSITSLFKWVQGHYGYANIMMGGLIAILLKLFFRKSNYNIFEITILLCFVMGEGMLLLALFSVIAGITKVNVFFILTGALAFIYTTLAIGQFYEPKKVMSYVKAFVAYVLGTILFYVIVILIGLLNDYLMK
jgi:hypothetical protein